MMRIDTSKDLDSEKPITWEILLLILAAAVMTGFTIIFNDKSELAFLIKSNSNVWYRTDNVTGIS
jgi:hypothetical protein